MPDPGEQMRVHENRLSAGKGREPVCIGTESGQKAFKYGDGKILPILFQFIPALHGPGNHQRPVDAGEAERKAGQGMNVIGDETGPGEDQVKQKALQEIAGLVGVGRVHPEGQLSTDDGRTVQPVPEKQQGIEGFHAVAAA